MLTWRTDLALEAAQLWRESAGEAAELPGVESAEELREGYPVTTVRILDGRGEQALYITFYILHILCREIA